MEVVTVKTKFQIVIPQRIREQAQVDIGDILEARVENGKITFTGACHQTETPVRTASPSLRSPLTISVTRPSTGGSLEARAKRHVKKRGE